MRKLGGGSRRSLSGGARFVSTAEAPAIDADPQKLYRRLSPEPRPETAARIAGVIRDRGQGPRTQRGAVNRVRDTSDVGSIDVRHSGVVLGARRRGAGRLGTYPAWMS